LVERIWEELNSVSGIGLHSTKLSEKWEDGTYRRDFACDAILDPVGVLKYINLREPRCLTDSWPMEPLLIEVVRSGKPEILEFLLEI